MVYKRKRRTIDSYSSLGPGEPLKRNNIVDLQWGWVSEVSDASNISDEHLLRTIGVSSQDSRNFCPNKYGEGKNTSLPEQLPVSGELDTDCIEISDNEEPLCSKKSCLSNPYCLNHLGQYRWEDYGRAL